MNKKIALFVGIMIVLIIGACAYFRPLNLTDAVSKSNTVMITMDTFTVEDGTPNIDMTEPNTLTDAQKEELVALIDGYSYRRTFGTLFSDGSMEGTGDRVVHIFLYDDQNVNTADIYLSDNGKISCGNKTYRMKNAKALVEQLAEYTGESTAQKPINYVSTSWMECLIH